ncbi:hypothetical protein [Acetobacter syzygii]|uniref:hypothetical protein n=1 Tax=Acetobacter syzygii TaxID=146476 RepID=UPI0039EA2BA1
MAKHTKTKEPGIYYRGPAQYEVKIRRKGVAVSRTFDTFADALHFKAMAVHETHIHIPCFKTALPAMCRFGLYPLYRNTLPR